MNDDYLWDRSGKPDPEIQQLEQVLGTLRYQPQPLQIPTEVRSGHRRTLFPRNRAIAAAVATMLIGGSAWLLLHRPNAPVGVESASNPPITETLPKAPKNVTPSVRDEVVAGTTNNVPIKNKPKGRNVHKNVLARNKQLHTLRDTDLTARQRAEAEAAKGQLLLALRVASTKLSLAQKKAQGGYPGNLIRNQHKVG